MFIHIRSVSYADNKDDEFFVFDFIDNSVVARSDTNKAILNKPVPITEPDIPASAGKD